MLTQAPNKVEIEGLFSENGLEISSFNRDGSPVTCIRGSIKVRVDNNEIPVQVFSSETKRDGNPNPSYAQWKRLIDGEYASISAVGEDKADVIRVQGSLNMNEYYSQDGRLVSFPRISGSFIKKVKAEESKPVAKFGINLVVQSFVDEIDRDGTPTGRLIVKGIVPMYGGSVDVFNFYVNDAATANAINQYWQPNDTVSAIGVLNFSSKTETQTVKIGFGAEDTIQKTINVSEVIITGGTEGALIDGYDLTEVQAALTKRTQKLAEDRARAENKGQKAPSVSKTGSLDLGF